MLLGVPFQAECDGCGSKSAASRPVLQPASEVLVTHGGYVHTVKPTNGTEAGLSSEDLHYFIFSFETQTRKEQNSSV